MDVRPTAVANIKPFGARIWLSCLQHYRARQATRSILLASSNRLLRVTINIYTADTIQSSLCAGSYNNHCTSHPKDRDWNHSRTAIMGFNVGYWVKERETARPWRRQRCVFLKMLKDTAMADGRYKYSTGGVVENLTYLFHGAESFLRS
jgi:hypothetical protein